MIVTAEYVSPGHPDRICDNIVNELTRLAIKSDTNAFVALECAVCMEDVFIDGRVALSSEKIRKAYDISIDAMIKRVYKDSGYGNFWLPYPSKLNIHKSLCIELMNDEEIGNRDYADDQCISNGYALNNPMTNYLPVEHFVANFIGTKLWDKYINSPDSKNYRALLGPDFKILVYLNNDNNIYTWDRLTLSMPHSETYKYADMFKLLLSILNKEILPFFKTKGFEGLSSISMEKFHLNGAGLFIKCGPISDNGLSGKKLAIDYYGPNVPIGGGAIYGKDIHKVDVVGAYSAKKLARILCEKHKVHEVFTQVSWSPGDSVPYNIRAYTKDQFGLIKYFSDNDFPDKDTFSIHCVANELYGKESLVAAGSLIGS